jgi:hypothetical protein
MRLRNVTLSCLIVISLWLNQITPASAQANIPITITTSADLTGNAGTQQVSASATTCRFVQFVALSTNTAVIRAGDSNVSSTRGVPLAAGGAWNTPASSNVNFVYALNSFYFYAASGDKLSVTCGN